MTQNIIGIIDSGIGGKGIEKEIKNILPTVKTIYLADTINFPYGTKNVLELNKILEKNIKVLIQKGAKIIVLACNSATVTSIEHLRKKFSIPIIGVEPAIKPASGITKTKNIAIFSTPITSQSEATDDLINKYCPGITVYKIPFLNLANLIELGKTSDATSEVASVWQKYKDKNIDVIVLGCTHYTLIKNEIQKIVGSARRATPGGSKINVIDSNQAVAHQAKKVYDEKGDKYS